MNKFFAVSVLSTISVLTNSVVFSAVDDYRLRGGGVVGKEVTDREVCS